MEFIPQIGIHSTTTKLFRPYTPMLSFRIHDALPSSFHPPDLNPSIQTHPSYPKTLHPTDLMTPITDSIKTPGCFKTYLHLL